MTKTHILSGAATRRTFVLGAGGLGAGALGAGLAGIGLGAWPALAQRKPPPPAEVSLDELMKPGQLPDISVGKADAPVTIVEYASMTCIHCANFHTKEFPKLKEKYIDTGKARLIYREYPLNNLASAGSMLARCAGGAKIYPMIGVLYEKFEAWVVNTPVPELFKIAKQAGFTQESFDACLTDQKLLEQLAAGRTFASEKLGVVSTPTFFINGRRHTAAPTFDEFEMALAPLMKS